jgi:mannose-1-phosphate guanylyltransferase
VFGAEVLYQLEASKPAVEIASAPEVTFAEDCTLHPSRSVISPSAREAGAATVAAVSTAAAKHVAEKKLRLLPANRIVEREKKFSLLPHGIILSSR